MSKDIEDILRKKIAEIEQYAALTAVKPIAKEKIERISSPKNAISPIALLKDPFLKVWRQYQFKLKLLIIIYLEIIGLAAVLISGTEYQSLPSVSFLAIMILISLTMLDWISNRENELGGYHLTFDRNAKYYFSKVWFYRSSS